MEWHAQMGQRCRRTLVRGTFIFLGSTIVFGNGHIDEAVRLVRLLQADRMMSLAHLLVLTHDGAGKEVVFETGAEKNFIECIASFDTNPLAKILAEGIREKMDAGEIRRAIHFFETPLGKKQVALDYMRLRETFSVVSKDEVSRNAEFSPEESKQYNKFKHSSEGSKLLANESFFSQRILVLAALKFEELDASCAKSASALSPQR